MRVALKLAGFGLVLTGQKFLFVEMTRCVVPEGFAQFCDKNKELVRAAPVEAARLIAERYSAY